MDQKVTFDITIDGSIQDISGNIEGINLEENYIHKLLYYAQKTLIDEEVVSVTIKSNEITLRIVANGAKFSGIIQKN